MGTEFGSPFIRGVVSLWWPRGYSGTSPEDPEIFPGALLGCGPNPPASLVREPQQEGQFRQTLGWDRQDTAGDSGVTFP